MKKLIKNTTLVTALLMLCSCAIVKTESNPVSKVVEVAGENKNQLYVKANNWMVSVFNNAESVIQFTDKESGTITGKYLLGTIAAASKYGSAQYAYAMIKIQVKDGASRITITPQSFTYAKGNIFTLYTKEKADRDIQALIQDFETAIQKKENNNW
ncbi:DUF4468 domain-containing protein [Wenyingzhuangia sp. IMCC45574]